MSQRVTEAEVKQIIDTALSDQEVTIYLCSASSLIDSLLTGLGYSTKELANIELWLAAHFISVRDPAVKNETIGAANVSYHGNIIAGTGLMFTPYGQQVLLFEYKGKFASLQGSKGEAEMQVIG